MLSSEVRPLPTSLKSEPSKHLDRALPLIDHEGHHCRPCHQKTLAKLVQQLHAVFVDVYPQVDDDDSFRKNGVGDHGVTSPHDDEEESEESDKLEVPKPPGSALGALFCLGGHPGEAQALASRARKRLEKSFRQNTAVYRIYFCLVRFFEPMVFALVTPIYWIFSALGSVLAFIGYLGFRIVLPARWAKMSLDSPIFRGPGGPSSHGSQPASPRQEAPATAVHESPTAPIARPDPAMRKRLVLVESTLKALSGSHADLGAKQSGFAKYLAELDAFAQTNKKTKHNIDVLLESYEKFSRLVETLTHTHEANVKKLTASPPWTPAFSRRRQRWTSKRY
ncbi:hypothetical protein BDK51DRAFT_36657 [Blyttiomyces helicus]|uniref:Uncharacterized protein n=1 Tax=Blyttiomyces helicus TaxID=388810 RepID=A0A4P9W4H2_9FUNG|nr:hypothetical protein BDK51DRAFT_36657 [Blyttiomyces helicus]|eukprot:RKO85590.1 hypothetical protein BDK51DRAFT_36657 [Blyttiomyces helicus]